MNEVEQLGKYKSKRKRLDHSLGNFTQSPSFFPEIRHNTYTSFLGRLYALLDGVGKVWLAGTDIGAKDVGAVAYEKG